VTALRLSTPLTSAEYSVLADGLAALREMLATTLRSEGGLPRARQRPHPNETPNRHLSGGNGKPVRPPASRAAGGAPDHGSDTAADAAAAGGTRDTVALGVLDAPVESGGSASPGGGPGEQRPGEQPNRRAATRRAATRRAAEPAGPR